MDQPLAPDGRHGPFYVSHTALPKSSAVLRPETLTGYSKLRAFVDTSAEAPGSTANDSWLVRQAYVTSLIWVD